MSEWVNTKLGEIATFRTGKLNSNAATQDGEYPFFTCSPITAKIDSFAFDEEALLLAGNNANGIFSLKYYKGKFNAYQRTYLINTVISDYKFLFYSLKLQLSNLANISQGTATKFLTMPILNNIELLLPPIKEQKAIAEVLSSLDDKIDLLHRQNKTLEELAQTLFRQWFIEEAKDEWEVCKLEDIAVIQNGFAFSSKHYVEEETEHLEVLKMGHIERGGGLKLNPKKDFVPREEKLEKYILNKNDIVLAMTDMKDNVVILGVPAIIDKSDKYVLNQRVARIYLKSNDKLLNSYLLYIQLKDPEFIALLQSTANSGVQVNLSTASIRESEVFVPPMNLQKTKGQDITDLYLKKENNDLQIKTLENMRDILLPKLMSGEVKVKMNGDKYA